MTPFPALFGRACMILSSVAALALAPSAKAEPATIAWTTFLYKSPSSQAQVIDEPAAGTKVDAGVCASGWCPAAVGRKSGYLREDVVARAGSPAPLAAPPAVLDHAADQGHAAPCFVAPQAGIASPPARVRFCAN